MKVINLESHQNLTIVVIIELVEGKVPSNKELVDGTVPSNKELVDRTVPSNSTILEIYCPHCGEGASAHIVYSFLLTIIISSEKNPPGPITFTNIFAVLLLM